MIRPWPGGRWVEFGDHFEGQFEGQNAAREGLAELVAAGVS
jgi:hypothetical protein